jgi:hypothetical protein
MMVGVIQRGVAGRDYSRFNRDEQENEYAKLLSFLQLITAHDSRG